MSLKVGDIVRVRGLAGAPEMVVMAIGHAGRDDTAVCGWYLADLDACEGYWPLAVLERLTKDEPTEAPHPLAAAIDVAALRDEQERAAEAKFAADADRIRFAHSEGW